LHFKNKNELKMKVRFTLAALALIAFGCTKQEQTETIQDNHTFVVTLQASMPENTDATRATYENDGAEISGIIMKWEESDKLKICFKHNDVCYYKDADIVPGSISEDGRKAKFNIEVPGEISDAATFDFHAVFQRKHPYNNNCGGFFQKSTTNFELVAEEQENVTLNQKGESGKGIINPMLLFSHKNTNKAGLAALKLDFAHTGWVMALHLKNNSGKEMELPSYIRIGYSDKSESSFIWNGHHSATSKVKMDVATGAVTADAPDWKSKACAGFAINEGKWNPLYNGKLAAGETLVVYRWLVSTDKIEKMGAFMQRKGIEEEDYSFNSLRARSVNKGKVYHVFVTWTGSAPTFTNRAGTVL